MLLVIVVIIIVSLAIHFKRREQDSKNTEELFIALEGFFNLILQHDKKRVPGSDRKSFEIGSARSAQTESSFSRKSNSLSSFRSSKIEMQTVNPKPRLSTTQLSSVRIAARSQVVHR